MKKIDLGVVVTTLIIVTISCSFAFFAARIVGNPKDINLVAKNVALTFTDTSSIADETISPGWNNVKSFTITNNSKEDFNYNILLKGLVNTFESINTLQYKITSDTGYNMDNYLNIVKTENSKDVVLAYDVLIPKGSKQTYQVEFKYISIDEDQSSDMGKKLGGTLAIEESTGKPKIYDKLLADNPTIKTRTDFSTIFTETNVNTLYKAKENNTDVYYFAGDARNNWVKFGEWQEDKTTILGDFKKVDSGEVITFSQKEFSTMAECSSYKITSRGINYEMANCRSVQIAKKGDPMYWRIIRSNQDGSIRLLYSGTSSDTEKGYIGTSVFSEFEEADPLNIGYMYGTKGSLENNRTNENSSVIKKYIDNWYNKHLLKLNSYISQESVYCQDRSISVNSSYDNYKTPGNYTFFSASDRIKTIGNNSNPTYSCASKEDSFSVLNTNTGNGDLKYSISLMTVDEAVYAGGLYHEKNEKVWYSNNSLSKNLTGDLWSWLLTPEGLSTQYRGNVYGLGENVGIGRIGSPLIILSNVLAVRPVISIKGDNIYKTGDGSAENPYIIEAVPVNTYEVNLNVNSGSGTGTVLVEEGKDAKFTVTPNDGYKAELETDTCGGTLSGSTYTISNITSGRTCSIIFKSDNPFPSGTLAYKIYEKSKTNEDGVYNENGYRYEGANPNNYIYMVKNGSNELWRIIGLFPDGTSGENVIRVRKVGYESAQYDSNSTNHWPKTTLYTTLSSTYSIANYKNTVNYTMYLGTNDFYTSYTSANLYDMERILNNKGMAGKTSSSSYSSTTTFIGSVGLMYPSDYGYAVLASDCARTTNPYSYDGTSSCHNNNWLYQGSSDKQWLISPHTSYDIFAFGVDVSGNVYTTRTALVTNYGYFSPVMALKSDVTVSGSGTQSDPYVMTN